MSQLYKMTDSALGRLLDRLAGDFRVRVLVRSHGTLHFASWPLNGAEFVVGGIRAVEPLKAFLFKARERLAERAPAGPDQPAAKPFCLVGVKACDLRALELLDFVFLNPADNVDPPFGRSRQEILLVASDCAFAGKTCFCTAMGGVPFAESGFDLNLSAVPGGVVVEVGSVRGRNLLETVPDLLQAVSEEDLEARNSARVRVREQVEQLVREAEIPERTAWANLFDRVYEAPVWRDEARGCVECGACNSICPTCHCFLLYDQVREGNFARLRTWDACLIRDFARVAGGANPREQLWMRLRNRFFKKFEFFPKVAGRDACTGCGRCIDACPARIDIRQVLRKVVRYGSGQPVSTR